VKDLRCHQDWPELIQAGVRCRAAREHVLSVWPEDTSPAELSAKQQLELEEATEAVIHADADYTNILERITAALDTSRSTSDN
jgi:hypothetical protein